jgi:hypothetical protein
MAFKDKLKDHKGCKCWDHLRAKGLTPPLNKRSKHPIMYPHKIIDDNQGRISGTTGN